MKPGTAMSLRGLYKFSGLFTQWACARRIGIDALPLRLRTGNDALKEFVALPFVRLDEIGNPLALRRVLPRGVTERPRRVSVNRDHIKGGGESLFPDL